MRIKLTILKKSTLAVVMMFLGAGNISAQLSGGWDASQQYNASGITDWGNGVVQLQTATFGQSSGAILETTNPYDPSTGAVFSQCYQVFFACPGNDGVGSDSKGDGAAFSFYKSTSTYNINNGSPYGVLSTAGGLGYMGAVGDPTNPATKMITVEFDTYSSMGGANFDNAYGGGGGGSINDEISVHKQGDASDAGLVAGTTGNVGNLEDGKEHTICITYTPSTTVLLVTIDGVTRLNYNMGGGGLSLQSYFGAGGLNISWSSAKFGAYSPITVSKGASISDNAGAVIGLPDPDVADQAICAGDPFPNFTVVTGGGGPFTSIQWSGLGTGTATTTSSTGAGNYIVDVTNAAGCSAKDTGVLVVNALPTPTVANNAICAGDPAATFTTGAYSAYAWSANGSGTAQTTSGTTAGNYTVQVTDAKGCKASATGVLTVNALPTPTVANKAICAGDPAATFDAGSYSAYLWSANGTGTAQTTSGTTAGNYTVQVTDAKGCKASATGVLTVNALPTPTVANKAICAGDPAATFDAGSYTSYVWSVNGTGTAQTTSGTTAGNYTVQVTDAKGCKASATGVLTVNALPTPSVANQSICGGGSATFDAGPGYSAYLWSALGTGTAQTTSGTTAGNYTVQVTDAKGCKASATGVLSTGSAVAPIVANKAICAGDPAVTFDAGPGYTSYTWSVNGTGTAQTTTGNTAGNYTVVVTSAGGCSATTTAVLTVNALPTPVVANKAICTGDPAATFDAGAGYAAYLWSANGTGAAQTTTGSIAGNYTVQVTDAKGCKAFATGVLTVNTLPVVDLGANQSMCAGASVTIDAGATFSVYKWAPGNQTTSSISVSTAGTYTVTVTDANGCKNSDAIDVTVNPNLTIDLGADKSICAGDNITFTANYAAAGVTYAWIGPAGYTNNTQAISPSVAGNYAVHVQDPLGCQGDGDVDLIVNPLPTPAVADQAKCAGFSATFNAGNYSVYSWVGPNAFTSAINPITVSQAGTYTVTVTDVNGCKNSDMATLTVNPNPIVKLGADYVGCEGTTAVFDAENPGADYLWNDASTAQTLFATVDGAYSVVVTDANGCIGTGAANARFVKTPTVEIGPNIDLCAGESARISAQVTPTNVSITWGTGEIGSSITVSSAGVISIAVSNEGMCNATDNLEVFVHDQPKVLGMQDTTVCFVKLSDGLLLDAGSDATQYNWSDGQSGQFMTVRKDGEYRVELVSDFGCTSNDTVIVSEDCPSSIFAPNAFTPNEDGVNDVFYVSGENIYDFELFVFDRWGEVIFHTNDMNTGWNGKKYNDLRNAQIDVYVWKISYKYWSDWKHDGKTREEVGRVSLLK